MSRHSGKGVLKVAQAITHSASLRGALRIAATQGKIRLRGLVASWFIMPFDRFRLWQGEFVINLIVSVRL